MAVSFRSEKDRGMKEPEMLVRYYISSADLTAEKFSNAMRSHWDVENKLHWRLEVAMNEDDCIIRRGNVVELFSGIRHIAVNVLTENKEFKAGLSLLNKSNFQEIGGSDRYRRFSIGSPWQSKSLKSPTGLPKTRRSGSAVR